VQLEKNVGMTCGLLDGTMVVVVVVVQRYG
jgi:hypothetical protein